MTDLFDTFEARELWRFDSPASGVLETELEDRYINYSGNWKIPATISMRLHFRPVDAPGTERHAAVNRAHGATKLERT
jgi:hypothetical protein